MVGRKRWLHCPNNAIPMATVFWMTGIDVQTLRLPPGGTLLLFSDGVTEATNAQGGFFGLESIEATVQAHLGIPAQQLCDQLVDRLTAYRGTSPQADDITLLAARAAAGG